MYRPVTQDGSDYLLQGDRDAVVHEPTARLSAVLGVAFAVLTVGINLADVTTDVIVAVEFYHGGHTTWCALVLTSLVLAHVIFIVLGLTMVHASPSWNAVLGVRKLPFAVFALLCVVFAQVLPLLNLVVETCAANVTSVRRQAQVASPIEQRRLFSLATTAVSEELKKSDASREMTRQFRQALETHMTRYGFFYVESAVEAAPQAVIQLLAITFLGKASPAQLVSLCCSLFSITSKAFIIARSYDARVFLFKLAVAAHDVFSTFYLFSTVLAIETVKQTNVFGLDVSVLGAIWFIKMVVYAAVIVQLWFILLVGFGVTTTRIRFVAKCVAMVGGVFAILLLPIALLVAEAVKLGFVVLALAGTEPTTNSWEYYAPLLTFLADDDGPPRPRLYHAAKFLLPWDPSKHSTKSLCRFGCELIAGDVNPCTQDCGTNGLAKKIAAWTLVCFLGVGQVFSFAYPFINAATQFHTHNILQATCFYGTCVALLLILLLSRRTLQFASVNRIFRGFVGTALVTDMIAAYFVPSQDSALVMMLSPAVIPAQLSPLVASYLPFGSVNMDNLTTADCLAINRYHYDIKERNERFQREAESV